MKTAISTHRVLTQLLGVVACTTLFSFSEFGGDSYTIYLNKKPLVQEYVRRLTPTPNITLDAGAAHDELQVYYSHCGEIGKTRTLIAKDEKQKVLKEWTFADATDEHIPMTIKTGELIVLPRDGTKKLGLFYRSKELPEGKPLANIILSAVATAGR